VLHRARRLLVLLAVPLLVSCASGELGRDPEPRSSAPRVRCLTDPQRDAREGTRPLFFFFCVESP
jgi:hypothetical protein